MIKKHRGGNSLVVEIDCNVQAVREATRLLRHFLEERGLSQEELDDWEFLAVEAGNNAVEHAPVEQRWLSVQFRIDATPEFVELTVVDHTEGFDWPELVGLPEDESTSGRGLFLLSTLSDGVRYERGEGGNRLVIQKRRLNS